MGHLATRPLAQELETNNREIDEVLEHWSAPAGFTRMPPIPAGRYIDPAFFQLEMKVLKKSWLYGLHDSELPEPGSWRLLERLGTPLLFVKQKDGSVKCFLNVCRHRGNPLVMEKCGKARGFICGAHGWTYHGDGRLAGVRDRKHFHEDDLRGRNLKEVRCETLGKLIFFNLDPDTPQSLMDHLGAIGDIWKLYHIDDTRFVRRDERVIKANYKVVQEANMEQYHIPNTHPDVLDHYADYKATATHLFKGGHSEQITRVKQQGWDDSRASIPVWPDVEAYSSQLARSFRVFPNMVPIVDAWGYAISTYWPIDLNTTLFEMVWIGVDAGAASPELESEWNKMLDSFAYIVDQDFQYSERIQQGLESGACEELLMGYQEQCIYQAHLELDRRIGRDRIPEGLRVDRVLEDDDWQSGT